jgi:cation diffusion facilitator family transporter
MEEKDAGLNSETFSKIGIKAALVSILVNALLAIFKGAAGIIGNSYALVADAIESVADIFSSGIVLFGLKMAGKPADDNHPYGHGKFEPLASVAVSFILIAAAIVIAVESVHEILTPHHAPAPFTLIVLVIVIIIKEILSRYVFTVGSTLESTALKSDAWHHRSDALTSAAAFIGISIAIIGGKGYESADDFAALIAAMIIAANAIHMLKPSLHELIDTAPNPDIENKVREIACSINGVYGTHNCTVRKVGFDYFVTLDVLCNPEESIKHGHDIAHAVGDAIKKEMSLITKVLVHVEPFNEFARHS